MVHCSCSHQSERARSLQLLVLEEREPSRPWALHPRRLRLCKSLGRDPHRPFRFVPGEKSQCCSSGRKREGARVIQDISPAAFLDSGHEADTYLPPTIAKRIVLFQDCNLLSCLKFQLVAVLGHKSVDRSDDESHLCVECLIDGLMPKNEKPIWWWRRIGVGLFQFKRAVT